MSSYEGNKASNTGKYEYNLLKEIKWRGFNKLLFVPTHLNRVRGTGILVVCHAVLLYLNPFYLYIYGIIRIYVITLKYV